ncbi:Alpha-1,6-mannosylglycoprotein 6-beta-N-acetylglucosaminyltransferase A [Anabarilius grahami]|uniref:Alpha-1,6-mannosylglycoprotein 6-beta-N-acetylglucosaminyltransferase A n=1 Tax=Anabarilius grahami TaxID=495550 RepID=A0A3N0Y4W8_ANAGA|nr:Alpha-1,6-mannosylglycoprotein 6-beta-N-acetylglucosaminyltransferase A [Anabarilius grahami]
MPLSMALYSWDHSSDYLLNGAQEKCELPSLDGFPHCEGKLKWMKDMWRSDPCYGNYGVDGSTCSFFIYLSEICGAFPSIIKLIHCVQRLRCSCSSVEKMADGVQLAEGGNYGNAGLSVSGRGRGMSNVTSH